MVVFLTSITSACGSQPVEQQLDQNAIIPNATEASTKDIREAASRLLNGAKIHIAQNPFSKTSFLSVHRQLLTGRDMGENHRFRLVKSANSCFLIYENTSDKTELPNLQCDYE